MRWICLLPPGEYPWVTLITCLGFTKNSERKYYLIRLPCALVVCQRLPFIMGRFSLAYLVTLQPAMLGLNCLLGQSSGLSFFLTGPIYEKKRLCLKLIFLKLIPSQDLSEVPPLLMRVS